jgi:hypothetical protein
MDGGASTKNESSKWEASKDEIHLVEQVWSSSDSLDSSKEEEENSEHTSILKKPIMNKWSEKQAEEAQKAGRPKKQWKLRRKKLHLEAEEIFQVVK